jgi:hypothetical protein
MRGLPPQVPGVLTIRTGPGDGLVVVSLRSAVWMAVGSIKLILPENDRKNHSPLAAIPLAVLRINRDAGAFAANIGSLALDGPLR